MRGQISLEFSIILLSMILVILITTMIPGLYGYMKTVETSYASLGHGALSKLKTNIEMLAVSDPGSTKTLYIKSPPGIWRINNRDIVLEGNGFEISTTCSVNLEPGGEYKTGLRVIKVRLEKVDDNTISINWE
ncbi:MAG TPA: class III signal peptide-containing protein [Methanothermococcus okinawensis]|uniref:Class III signal peptide-containing protein n=1 Tax=Methanothermococcus okinawensis TaxID=155863 RepID=A0A833E1H4_9EURY|nr:class III signal peptide-containing protein [Methanothermococcus okinawensis]